MTGFSAQSTNVSLLATDKVSYHDEDAICHDAMAEAVKIQE